jgi:DNA-binding transcriptional LysR family regulator
MRLEWLKDVLTVAETGSFTEAAQRRHLTQSAFSRRIQMIEDCVGVELFDRSKKPIQLRPTTEDQRNQVAHIAGLLEQLADDLRRGDRMSGNRAVVASQHSLTTSLMPGLLKALHLDQPDIHIRLRSANLDECLALLLSRQVDVSITYRTVGNQAGVDETYLEVINLGVERLVPVFATAGLEGLDDEMARGRLPTITYPGDVFFGQVFNRLVLPSLDERLQIISKAETALTLAALELAKVGLGVAWLPLALVGECVAEGKLADLSHRLGTAEVEIVASRLKGAKSPSEALLWDRLGEMVRTPEGR